VRLQGTAAAAFKLEHVKPGFVAELLAAVRIRNPSVPIIFLESRPLAEEWTFRFLGAALVGPVGLEPTTRGLTSILGPVFGLRFIGVGI
jgi:hypothetical protein